MSCFQSSSRLCESESRFGRNFSIKTIVLLRRTCQKIAPEKSKSSSEYFYSGAERTSLWCLLWFISYTHKGAPHPGLSKFRIVGYLSFWANFLHYKINLGLNFRGKSYVKLTLWTLPLIIWIDAENWHIILNMTFHQNLFYILQLIDPNRQAQHVLLLSYVILCNILQKPDWCLLFSELFIWGPLYAIWQKNVSQSNKLLFKSISSSGKCRAFYPLWYMVSKDSPQCTGMVFTALPRPRLNVSFHYTMLCVQYTLHW